MPDRYIERKGIIFDKIAEKGETDQVAKLVEGSRVFGGFFLRISLGPLNLRPLGYLNFILFSGFCE